MEVMELLGSGESWVRVWTAAKRGALLASRRGARAPRKAVTAQVPGDALAQEPWYHHCPAVCAGESHTQGNSSSLTKAMKKQHPARTYFSSFSHNFALPRFPRQALAEEQAQAPTSPTWDFLISSADLPLDGCI